MTKIEITIDGIPIEALIDAKKNRDIAEQRQAEVKALTKQALKHHTTKRAWGKRGPGRPSRAYQPLLWARMERLISEGLPLKRVASECGVRRRDLRKYRKQYEGKCRQQSASAGASSAPTDATPTSGDVRPAA
jgi:hypothetical protein